LTKNDEEPKISASSIKNNSCYFSLSPVSYTILMLKREKTSFLKCVPGSSRMEMNELERVFGVARQRIICVSLSLTVKSINNNKNTHKHLPINAGGKKLFGQRKLLDHPSTHNF